MAATSSTARHSSSDRLRFLWSSATSLHPSAPDLSRVLLLGLDRRAAASSTPLPARARQRCCGACFAPLAPGVNAHVTSMKHGRRPAARRRTIRVRCDACGHVGSFDCAEPPSSRATSASAAAATTTERAPPKPNKSRNPGVGAPEPPKRKRPKVAAQPAPAAATATSESTPFFGFDFVPLG